MGWAQLTGIAPSGHALYPATGTFYNPVPLCAFLSVVMPMAHYAAMNNGPKAMRWTSVFYLVLAVGLMPVPMGRMGWIAAVAGCGVVYFGSEKSAVLHDLLSL